VINSNLSHIVHRLATIHTFVTDKQRTNNNLRHRHAIVYSVSLTVARQKSATSIKTWIARER